MKEKRRLWLPILLMVVFAITRWPGLLPPNFSAAYALSFCAGVFFPRRMAWWLPLTTLLISDLLINCYYQFVQHIDAWSWRQLINYGAYALLIWLGTTFNRKASLFKLVGGGLLSAIIFYLVTNTASWLFDPDYSKTLPDWIRALTQGIPGYPPTWAFFRNTLLSGGLFAGLFAGAMKLTEEPEPERESDPEPAEEAEQPQERKA